jgi:hypothetical protein
MSVTGTKVKALQFIVGGPEIGVNQFWRPPFFDSNF